ncbi:FANCI solenoid 1-domain-containing protein [Tribonema minus]|uniref:FANCI solenoid 1-domain-containing protein n=1 Tax=Tribonema minus TaxID=303371 RepID=A0A835YPY5_9STRA|nr:FANCI solenoid 1-domain-containing protein [Tribonema minus]
MVDEDFIAHVLAAASAPPPTPLANATNTTLSQSCSAGSSGPPTQTKETNATALIRELDEHCDAADFFRPALLHPLSKRNPAEAVRYVGAVLAHSQTGARGTQRSTAGVLAAIGLVQRGFVEDRHARTLLEKCQGAINTLQPRAAPALVEKLLEPLTSGELAKATPASADAPSPAGFIASLDLLPKLLAAAAALGDARLLRSDGVSAAAEGLDGAAFAARAVDRVLRAPWPEACGVGLTRALGELPLDGAQLRAAAARALRHLRGAADLHTLPPLALQLLLLAARGDGAAREAVLAGVVRAFDGFNAAAAAADAREERGGVAIRSATAATAELLSVQGTVLLHCDGALRADHELAAAALRALRRDAAAAPRAARALSPFRLALLLTLVRVQRFSAAALDGVAAAIAEACAYARRRAACGWFDTAERTAAAMERRGGAEALADADAAPRDAILGALLRVVEWSGNWEFLLPSLKELGVKLMDLGRAPGKTAGGAHAASAHTAAAANDAALVGRALLRRAFEAHELAQRPIMEEVLSRVKGGASAAPNLYGHLQLLQDICGGAATAHLALSDHTGAIRDTLGYLGALPPRAAVGLLRALAAPLRLRPPLQDSAVLALRKALFSGVEETRITAAEGVVALLTLQGGGGGGSSGGGGGGDGNEDSWSFSQRERAGGGSVGGGCAFTVAEGLGLLRRCLAQQAVVRSRLYTGLVAALRDGNCSVLGLPVVEMLAGHLRRFMGPAADAPLLLRKAVDDARGIAEPLPHLIAALSAMRAIAAAAGSSSGGSSSGSGAGGDPLAAALSTVAADMAALARNLAALDPAEYGIAAHKSFAAGDRAGRGNLAVAALLVGCCEALMADALRNGAGDAEGALRTVLSLAAQRSAVIEVVRGELCGSGDKAKGGKGKGAKGGGKGTGKGKKQSKAVDAEDEEGNAPAAAQHAPPAAAAVPHGPAFSATSPFALTLQPHALPCLGPRFVTAMLAVLNSGGSSNGSAGDDMEIEVEVGGSSAVRRARADAPLQRLVLETARAHLRALRSNAGTPAGQVDGYGTKAPASQTEAAAGAGAAAAAVCAELAPLLLREARRQLAAQEAVQRAAEEAEGGDGDGGSDGDEIGDDDDEEDGPAKKKAKGKGKPKGAKKAQKKKKQDNLAELALTCFEECITVCAATAPTPQDGAQRVLAALEAAHGGDAAAAAAAADGEEDHDAPPLQAHALQLVKLLGDVVNDSGATPAAAQAVARAAAAVCALLPHCDPNAAAPSTGSSSASASSAQGALDAFVKAVTALCAATRTKNPGVARALLRLLLRAHLTAGSIKGDIVHLKLINKQLVDHLGPRERDEEGGSDGESAAAAAKESGKGARRLPPNAAELRILTHTTAQAAAEAALEALEECTAGCELAAVVLAREMALSKGAAASPAADSEGDDGGGGGGGGDASDGESKDDDLEELDDDGFRVKVDAVDSRENYLAVRIRLLLEAAEPLLRALLPARSTERLLAVIFRIFKVLGRILKARIAARRMWVLRQMHTLLVTKAAFCRPLQECLGAVGSSDQRCARRMPELVGQLTRCDSLAQQLAAAARFAGARRWDARNTARDFKLDHSEIVKEVGRARNTARDFKLDHSEIVKKWDAHNTARDFKLVHSETVKVQEDNSMRAAAAKDAAKAKAAGSAKKRKAKSKAKVVDSDEEGEGSEPEEVPNKKRKHAQAAAPKQAKRPNAASRSAAAKRRAAAADTEDQAIMSLSVDNEDNEDNSRGNDDSGGGGGMSDGDAEVVGSGSDGGEVEADGDETDVENDGRPPARTLREEEEEEQEEEEEEEEIEDDEETMDYQ